MTPIQLHRLAGAIATLRPDWPPQSIQTFLEKHFTHRPLRDIAVALTYVAVDPTTTTPARVLEAGPWWQSAATRDVPTAVNDCPTHPHTALWVDNRTSASECSGCRNDRRADETATATFDRKPVPDDVREALRRPATPTHATSSQTGGTP